jgi:hypothetical protein
VDVSLAALRSRLYALRSWDSTGATLDARIRAALNLALDRIAGDIPEAIVPDEEHVVLLPTVAGDESTVDSKVATYGNDKRLLYFVDSAGASIGAPASLTTWRPTVTGEWDGLMHLEVTDSAGRIRRRQSREWFTKVVGDTTHYIVSIDRPMPDIIAGNAGQSFRIHQPEFFLSDDVMEVLEPARIFDDTRQQVYKIATASAYRDDLLDFQGSHEGRPYRCWRNRHFQLPAPTEAPTIVEIDIAQRTTPDDSGIDAPNFDEVGPQPGPTTLGGTPTGPGRSIGTYSPSGGGGSSSGDGLGPGAPPTLFMAPAPSGAGASATFGTAASAMPIASAAIGTSMTAVDPAYKWSANALREGTWAVRYTYVWGRRDDEWQQSPLIAPGGDQDNDSTFDLNWAYETDSVLTNEARYTGINDPLWESAPSPVKIITQKNSPTGDDGALVLSATNIDSMLGFGDSSFDRFSRSGLRIRYYVAHLDKDDSGVGSLNAVETSERFYLLCEVEPTFDHVQALADSGITAPDGLLRGTKIKGARVVWDGSNLYDYYRPLKHSTGYYAWQVYPKQDQRYELDFRVLRLPKKFIDDQDTAPIQRDAVPCLIELALYYVSLDDGNDQQSAQAHLNRYHELMRGFRQRYANVGGSVEPVPFTGYRSRDRYGTFSTSE